MLFVLLLYVTKLYMVLTHDRYRQTDG